MRRSLALAALAGALLITTPYASVPENMRVEAAKAVQPLPTQQPTRSAPSQQAVRRQRYLDGLRRKELRQLTAHKTRSPGERAHRRWRQRRSSGIAA